MSSNWIKWFHNGVPDQEGTSREDKRNLLKSYYHCKRCTSLSGCYFPIGNMPQYKLHDFCDCLLFNITKPTKSSLTTFCDIRKFTEYVFAGDKQSKGKNGVFEEWGFTIDDSAYLKNEYESQALSRYLNGDYVLGTLNDYGQRITITIVLPTNDGHVKIFKTGWMVHPLGKITCNTPFAGYIS